MRFKLFENLTPNIVYHATDKFNEIAANNYIILPNEQGLHLAYTKGGALAMPRNREGSKLAANISNYKCFSIDSNLPKFNALHIDFDISYWSAANIAGLILMAIGDNRYIPTDAFFWTETAEIDKQFAIDKDLYAKLKSFENKYKYKVHLSDDAKRCILTNEKYLMTLVNIAKSEDASVEALATVFDILNTCGGYNAIEYPLIESKTPDIDKCLVINQPLRATKIADIIYHADTDTLTLTNDHRI